MSEPVMPERWLPTLNKIHAHPYSVVYSLATELGAAEAKVAELERELKWQPINTAPLDGFPILVNFGRCGVHCVLWEKSVTGTMSWCVDDRKHGPYALRGYVANDIQGWMYLPRAIKVQP